MTHTQLTDTSIIVICWALFVLFWLIMMFTAKRTVWRQGWGERGLQSALMALGAICLIDGSRLNIFNPTVWPFSPALGAIAISLAVIGLIVLIWSRVTLGRNWSGRVVLKENHELVTSGPYAFIRHPIYSGLMFLAVGSVLNAGMLIQLIGAFLLLGGVTVRMFQEEALMAKQFPNEYPGYMKRTKRIIPWIW